MRKNVASQKIGCQMVSATDGSAFTGSVTVAVTVDAGTQATGSVGSGACTHEGNGYHTYAPAQAETNGDLIAFTFTGTGAVPATVQVYTVSFDPHDTVRLGLTALPNAAADAAGGLPISDAGGLDLDGRLDAAVSSRSTLTQTQVTGGAYALNSASFSFNSGLDFTTTQKAATIAAVTTVTTTTNLTNLPAITANWLTAAGTAADFTTEIQTGLATAANLATAKTAIDGIKAVTDLLPDAGALTSLATASALATADGNVDAILVIANKLDDTLEDDSGTYRFTANALEEGPAGGGGGDATEAKQDTIIAALGVIDGIVDDILLDTAEIGTAGAGLTNINLPNQTMDITGNISGTVGGMTAAGWATAFTVDTTKVAGDAIAGSVVYEIGQLAASGGLTVGDIVDGLLDEAIAGHLAAGTVGDAIYVAATRDVALTSTSIDAVVDAVWDEVGSGHVTSGTFGGIANGLALLAIDGIGRVTVGTNADKTGYSLANSSFVTATFGTCDFTATMKTSIGTAVAASAVASVTGNVGGNVTGSVGSVLGGIDTSGGTVKTLDAAIAALATAHGAGSWATATGFSTHSAADVWANGTRTLTAGTNIALAKGTGVTGFNDLSAAQVNTEVDAALADYDAPTNAELEARTILAAEYATAANQTTILAGVSDIPTNAELATALASADDAVLAAIAALNNLSSAGVSSAVTTALTTALTEGYRATGATGSVRDLLYEIIGNLVNFANAGTTRTVTKLDKATTAKTYAYDDADNPTSVEETT